MRDVLVLAVVLFLAVFALIIVPGMPPQALPVSVFATQVMSCIAAITMIVVRLFERRRRWPLRAQSELSMVVKHAGKFDKIWALIGAILLLASVSEGGAIEATTVEP